MKPSLAQSFFAPSGAPDPSWSDADLVRACLDGREAAWAALLDKYKRLIYSIPFRYGAAEADAADIFQLVCMDLYAELPRLRNVEALRGWLMTVTARHSLRWKNRRVTLPLEDGPEPATGPEWPAEFERLQLVQEGIARLSERCRTLITRLFYDDPPKPYEALAAELGLATGSIGFTRGRCLDKLRKTLLELGL
jgi:RNA polymerase sigma factor (sigma-70 family)